MEAKELLRVLHTAERLKDETRHCYTSGGRRESVAEHSWRLALTALFLRDEFPALDMDRVIRMCLIHDLGECFTGDIPSFLKSGGDEERERLALETWVASLPAPYSVELKALYAEMDALETDEARLYKALDKLEAVIQHNESDIATWLPREYELNLTYADENVAFSDYLKRLREEIRRETRDKIAAAEHNRQCKRCFYMAGTVHEVENHALLAEVEREAANAAQELVEAARLHHGQIVVIGCSTSEVVGHQVGSWSTPEAAQAIFRGLQSVFAPRGVYLAAQCCEHLNRALIVEHDAVPNAEIVNVLPQPKAGSSFATAAYESFRHPVALEEIRADAGLDIGGTLIGMHLKKVAVPVRLKQDHIGQAIVLAARVRPKFIGGERAIYNEELKNGYPDFDAE